MLYRDPGQWNCHDGRRKEHARTAEKVSIWGESCEDASIPKVKLLGPAAPFWYILINRQDLVFVLHAFHCFPTICSFIFTPRFIIGLICVCDFLSAFVGYALAPMPQCNCTALHVQQVQRPTIDQDSPTVICWHLNRLDVHIASYCMKDPGLDVLRRWRKKYSKTCKADCTPATSCSYSFECKQEKPVNFVENILKTLEIQLEMVWICLNVNSWSSIPDKIKLIRLWSSARRLCSGDKIDLQPDSST